MNKLKAYVKKTPAAFRLAIFFRRAMGLGKFLSRQSWNGLRWLFSSREFTNTTYHYTERNLTHLAVILHEITGVGIEHVKKLFDELENDTELRRHLSDRTKGGPGRLYSDSDIRYTRRTAWYALTRILRPRVVIETGVDKGLGSAVLCAALLRNREEGYKGTYYGTDINPEAGFLLGGRYNEVGTILYGDSIESLNKINDPIDLFVNDSDHSAEYEAREYIAVKDKLAPDAVILGDNAHCNDKLLEFAQATGRKFLFHRETPLDHWYPGDGIGFAFTEGRQQVASCIQSAETGLC
jgi:hypothetical protein